ncbi:Respiratory supercomplex factor 1, mitochondrial [Varicellaria rhodocarpa]|nr:Respiratory supercomplex factor 1, mitochondrial [Varicellaria rhodocarpa]
MSSTGLPSSFDGDTDFYEESRWQKFSRLLKEEPVIPFGCGLTCWALFGASRSIRRGDSANTNRMFRFRIYAQGFTIVAMVLGSMYWKTDRQKRKEFEGAVKERKAKEKNEAWIRELEARDLESKEIAAQKEALREQMRKAAKVTMTDQGERDEDSSKTEQDKKEESRSTTERDGREANMPKCVIEKKEERLGILDAVREVQWRSAR